MTPIEPVRTVIAMRPQKPALAAAIAAIALLLSGCADFERTRTLQNDLDGLTKAGVVGAVSTVSANRTTTVLTSGVGDRTTGAEIADDSRVRVGSITKAFTSAIIMQLVAEGKVDLDRAIDGYLPGVIAGAGGDGTAITVRQLMQHRSGLPEFAGEPGADELVAASENRTITPAQAVAIAMAKPAQFPPGSRFLYTNTNYIVLGMLIEAVTRHSYTDELTTRILGPLGLEDTYLPGPGERAIRGPHPTGYQDVHGVVTDVSMIEPSVPWSAGALVSTGRDINRFWLSLLDGKVVPRAQLDEMTTAQPAASEAEGMGYGLGVGSTDLPCGVRYVGHTGGIPGYYTLSGASTEGRAVTITLTQIPTQQTDSEALLSHALCP
jgi:D-alanyl-D-alanine carboxypeptidase